MGTSVIIVPNVYDYWIEIMNPCKELLEVLSHFQASIIQEVKVMQEERWEYFKISAHLLAQLINHDQIVKELLKGVKIDQLLFVTRCTHQETIDSELYQLLQQISTVVHPKSSPLIIQKCFQDNLLFGFEKPGFILDLHTAFDTIETKECKSLPKEYLLIELKQTYTISKVIDSNAEAIFHSPLSEKLILQLIKKVIGRSLPDELIDTIDSIINDVFEKGNYAKADLLVEDIFGLENCSIVGLPPKLVASSLAKYAKEKESTSTIWDQLQSLLVAFALNIGTLAKEQIFLTKTPQVIFKTNQIANKVFFSIINTVLAPYGEVWFVKSGSTPLLHSEDIVREKVSKLISQ